MKVELFFYLFPVVLPSFISNVIKYVSLSGRNAEGQELVLILKNFTEEQVVTTLK